MIRVMDLFLFRVRRRLQAFSSATRVVWSWFGVGLEPRRQTGNQPLPGKPPIKTGDGWIIFSFCSEPPCSTRNPGTTRHGQWRKRIASPIQRICVESRLSILGPQKARFEIYLLESCGCGSKLNRRGYRVPFWYRVFEPQPCLCHWCLRSCCLRKSPQPSHSNGGSSANRTSKRAPFGLSKNKPLDPPNTISGCCNTL